VDGSEFCVHHVKLVEKEGAAALRRGSQARIRRYAAQEPLLAKPEPSSNDGAGSVDGTLSPAEVRPALAQAAASSLNEIQTIDVGRLRQDASMVSGTPLVGAHPGFPVRTS
jgi:hypothetical protein